TEVAFDPTRCLVQDYNPAEVIHLFNELEFRSMIRDLPDAGRSLVTTSEGGPIIAPAAADSATSGNPALPGTSGASSNAVGKGQMALFAFDNDEAVGEAPGWTPVAPALTSSYLIVDSAETLETLREALNAAAQFSFDVETTSQDAMSARLVGLGVCWGARQAAYVPIAHASGPQLPWEAVKAALQPAFANAAVPKLTHNGKYDLTVLLENGMDVQGPIHDTMVLAWILDPASRMLGLKAQASVELDWHMVEIASLIGSGKKQITIDQVAIETVAAYCGGDVDATWQLYAKLAPRVREQGMWELYAQIELPLLPVLTDMERTGVLLDPAYLAVMSEKLSKRLRELEQELFGLVGHEFNLRSTQQMSNVLFSELGFPTKGMTRTTSGLYSTAVSELEKLRTLSGQLSELQSKVLDCIFEQRQLEKLRGTYVDALPLLVNPRTGRVHTSFNQAGAVTGRMSSSDPNLQNIPIRTDLGREIRRAFVVPPGHLLLSADYSQVELRVLAHVAQEQSFIDAFNADADIHAATAARLFNVPLETVTKAQRGLGKTINFATVYGSSAYGISSRTELDPQQAREFLDQYFVTYPRIKAFLDEVKVQALRDGYVSTLLGRKRYFPELSNPRTPINQRMALERQAINAPIQGTAADIMKIAMLRLHEALHEQKLRSRMLLQVHDELVLEVPLEERDAAVQLTRQVMSSAYALVVPLKVDVEVGPNWYDLEPA
ncbi:MAG: DNA polymerase I, partial [Caldilineaceae bacterium]